MIAFFHVYTLCRVKHPDVSEAYTTPPSGWLKWLKWML